MNSINNRFEDKCSTIEIADEPYSDRTKEGNFGSDSSKEEKEEKL